MIFIYIINSHKKQTDKFLSIAKHQDSFMKILRLQDAHKKMRRQDPGN